MEKINDNIDTFCIKKEKNSAYMLNKCTNHGSLTLALFLCGEVRSTSFSFITIVLKEYI